MAVFAQLDDSNIVIHVIVVDDSNAPDEETGAAFCHSLLAGRWLMTCQQGSTRKNYAGIGYTYDPVRDAFIPPKPGYPSWILDDTTCQWVAPIPMPDDGQAWHWSEDDGSWLLSPPLTEDP